MGDEAGFIEGSGIGVTVGVVGIGSFLSSGELSKSQFLRTKYPRHGYLEAFPGSMHQRQADWIQTSD